LKPSIALSNPKEQNSFTPYAEVNSLLSLLLEEVQAVLGDQFIGMYLDGSLASRDFDADSDIDFVVVTRDDIAGELFLRLQAMHDRMATSTLPGQSSSKAPTFRSMPSAAMIRNMPCIQISSAAWGNA